jgi:hypothetical protein
VPEVGVLSDKEDWLKGTVVDDLLEHQNKHRIIEMAKMAKKGRPEIVILWELVFKIALNVMLRR